MMEMILRADFKFSTYLDDILGWKFKDDFFVLEFSRMKNASINNSYKYLLKWINL